MAFSTDNIGKNCYINMSEDENVEDSLYGTIIGYYKDTDKNEEYYFISINGNVKRIYDDSLVNIIEDGGSVTPGTLIMVSGEMTEEQATQFRENIGAISIDDIGTVFVLKGSVNTVGDLPVSGNSVGDVYYVKEDSVGYIWLISDSHPNGYWEELGKAFDITVDSELSSTSTNPVQNKVINASLATKGTYSKPSGGIPKSDLANDVQTSLGKADTALQSAPVTSVNGKTGIVDLDADDVGALPNDTPIPAAVTEQTVSGWGFTKNTGTYIKPSSGIPKSDLASAVQTSLGKADTALQVAPVASVNGRTGVVVLGANDVGALPSNTPIPSAVTEQTVSDWGFTKNTGTYSKPSSGIPKSDLSSAVQTSLGKADTALQSVPSTYRTASAQDIIDAAQDTAIAAKYTKPSGGIPDSDIASAATWNAKGTYSKPSGGIPKSDLSSAVQTSLGKADTALQSVPNTYRTAAAQDLIDEAQDARINQKANTADLAKVATTGSYNDLSDKPTIPSLSGYATETWVTNKGYQTAAQVQTAISNVRQLPVVSASDNGKFLRVVSGAWTAVTVPSAETASF